MACVFCIWERFQVYTMGQMEYLPGMTAFNITVRGKNIEVCKGGNR
jgi:hypothetical protein